RAKRCRCGSRQVRADGTRPPPKCVDILPEAIPATVKRCIFALAGLKQLGRFLDDHRKIGLLVNCVSDHQKAAMRVVKAAGLLVWLLDFSEPAGVDVNFAPQALLLNLD